MYTILSFKNFRFSTNDNFHHCNYTLGSDISFKKVSLEQKFFFLDVYRCTGGRNFESRPWQSIIRVYSPKRVHTGHLNESDGSRVTKFARRVPMKNSASLAELWLVDALRRQRGQINFL